MTLSTTISPFNVDRIADLHGIAKRDRHADERETKNIVTSRDTQEYSAENCQRDAEMIDDHQVKKQVFIRHLGSPLVMAPMLMGVTSLAAAWAFDWKTAGLAAFAGITGILASGGIFLTRLILNGQKTATKVIQEHESERIQKR